MSTITYWLWPVVFIMLGGGLGWHAHSVFFRRRNERVLSGVWDEIERLNRATLEAAKHQCSLLELAEQQYKERLGELRELAAAGVALPSSLWPACSVCGAVSGVPCSDPVACQTELRRRREPNASGS